MFLLINRVVHQISLGFLSGAIALNYFFNTNEFLADDPNYLDFALPLAFLVALTTGILETFMLRP